MGRWWFAALLAPLAYFAAMLTLVGVRLQPDLVMSRSPEAFRDVVQRAGGAGALRTGAWVDAGFALVFVVVAVALLSRTGGWWWLPLVAAGLDLLEGLMILVLVDRVPSQATTTALAVVSVLKLVAYAASVVALGLAWRRA